MGIRKPVSVGPRELLPPIDTFSVPKGYEFDAIVVTEVEGRQYVNVQLIEVPPAPPEVVFEAHQYIQPAPLYDDCCRDDEPPF